MIPDRFGRLYAGPDVPVAYDPTWQSFTNLTPAQILVFQSFPQDLNFYIRHKRWTTEISAVTLPVSAANPSISGLVLDTNTESISKIAELKQALDNGTIPASTIIPFSAVNAVANLSAADVTALYKYLVQYVLGTYAISAALLAQVNATPQSLTTRAAVDAAMTQAAIQAQINLP
jgi:hypothetical protein